MSSRLAFDSWQMLFPAIGFCVFVAIFLGVIIRVWRMKRPSVDRLGKLPLEAETPRSANHVRSRE